MPSPGGVAHRLSAFRNRLRHRPLRGRLFKLAGRWRGDDLWQDLRTYCFFVGYARSGHSAIGSAIDAHPMAAIAHELNAVSRFFDGTSRQDLFLDIFWLSREQARLGRRSPRAGGGTYLHRIDGQLERTPGKIRSIGDKRGTGTVRAFAAHGLERIDDFKAFVGLPTRILHVIRNPFDVVATAIVNDEADETYSFLQILPVVAEIRERYGDSDWMDVYHEDVIEDPKGQMERILEFLELPVLDAHLDRCAAYFYSEPRKRRFEVPWTPQLKLRTQSAIEEHDFLRRYSWDS